MEATAPVTVERAAAILGVSPSTVHRRIRSGALRAEQAERPRGRGWLVHLPPGVAIATEDLPPPTGPEAAAPAAVPAQAEAMVSLIQATIGTVLGPLVSELAANRQVIERQADTIGQLRANLATVRAENRALVARTEAQNLEPTQGATYAPVAAADVVAVVGVGAGRGGDHDGGAVGVAAVSVVPLTVAVLRALGLW